MVAAGAVAASKLQSGGADEGARRRLAGFCVQHGMRDVEELPGGAVSAVVRATRPDGRVVALKTVEGGVASLRSEAGWLRRHPSAPEVFAAHEEFGVLEMEYLDAVLLSADPPPLDATREGAWLRAAADAGAAATDDVDDVRDRYRVALGDLAGRPAVRRWDVAGAEQWMWWADQHDGRGWRSVALDVIMKNTLVDVRGRWWAIDPMCAAAPDALVWCPWANDRAVAASRAGHPCPVEVQEAVLATSVHAEVSRDWMPGSLLWTLWWHPQERAAHPVVLDLLDEWLARWAARHAAGVSQKGGR